jgi:predicted nucleic acid-binding protein
MLEVYLIDTSVWIDSLRQTDNGPVRFFKLLIAGGTRYGITGAIYQEVLQGARDRSGFDRLRTDLGSLTFYHPLDSVESYAEAAQLYRRCRERGLTIRSTLDCLIARIAIEHSLILVHNDRDFDHLAGVCADLKCAPSDTQH